MTTASVLKLNPSSKQEIETFSSGIIEQVKSGSLNPLEAHTRLTAMEKSCEIIKKEIRENVMSAVDKYSEKRFFAFGAEIEKTETGVKYDFSGCGDVEYNEAVEQEKAWSEKRKSRETFLKTLTKPMSVNNEETGEVLELRPPVKTSSSFIKVTMK